MKMRFLKLISATAVAVATTVPSYALNCLATSNCVVVVGHVTLLEPTYMPTQFDFQLDNGYSTCPAGSWIFWSTGPTGTATPEAAYASMLSALLSGDKVDVYFTSGDTTCTGEFIHFYRSP